MDGELLIGRRFDTRALAVQWAKVERHHLEKGWLTIATRVRSQFGGQEFEIRTKRVAGRWEATAHRLDSEAVTEKVVEPPTRKAKAEQTVLIEMMALLIRKYGPMVRDALDVSDRTDRDQTKRRVMVSSFDRLAKTRLCPRCAGPLRVYVTEDGAQLLACIRCEFEMADRPSESLDKVRQFAKRDRRAYMNRNA
jgi:hypothetical protein